MGKWERRLYTAATEYSPVYRNVASYSYGKWFYTFYFISFLFYDATHTKCFSDRRNMTSLLVFYDSSNLQQMYIYLSRWNAAISALCRSISEK